MEISDFIEFFPETNLPFKITDSGLLKKQSDSLMIAYKVLAQFMPDSIIKKDFEKNAPVFYPLGRAKEKGRETYLFIKAEQAKKKVAYLVCFDKDNNYRNALPLVKFGIGNFSASYGSLDKKFQITTYQETRKSTGETWYKRNVYVYNSDANDFTLILTEPNEEMIQNIINPIDTLPKKHKLSGDYIKDKQNFISIRDGRNSSELLFFVHFDRDNSECVGELKGAVKLVSPNKATYKENGNPCSLEFTFSSSGIVMKEIEGCGSYRDIKCFFEGRFPRKKETKPKAAKKKK